MPDPRIAILGAREHNLQNVSLELPRDRLIVFTGVSGSGKTSLAFDTIYAEGQRRYIESLSTTARQYVGQLHRPDVDRIEGLSPAVAIQQKATSSNPRSTVATVTEIYDYLRVFYARLGTIECCGRPVGRQTTSEIIERILELPQHSRIQLLAPIARQRRGEFREVFEDARASGFVRVRVDGEVLDLSSPIRLDRQRRHDLELVIDRLVVKPDIRTRLADSVELALQHGEGLLIVNVIPPDADAGEDVLFSKDFTCPVCGTAYLEPSPQLFSFNSLQGMCPSCQGLGTRPELDPELAIPDPSLSINAGAVAPWGEPATLRLQHVLKGLAKHFKFSLDTPWRELSEEARQVLLYGTDDRVDFTYVSGRGRRYPYQGEYHGVLAYFQHDGNEHAAAQRRKLSQLVQPIPCPDCRGNRLRPEALRVKVGGLQLSELTRLPIHQAATFFDDLVLRGQQVVIGEDLVREIRGRLNFLINVGLHYLTLDRPAPTLSGGEGQRIRLASQIGAGLVGVTYVLDEPSIGLHHRDNKHLLSTLQRLRDLGNTVIVVEHDEETMRAADYLVDIGPGPGRLGGQVVAAGTCEEVAANPNSVTARYLNGEQAIDLPAERRPVDPERVVRVLGARQNNLRELDVEFPLGCFIAVTGVSGSGKSSLVNEILYPALANALNRAEAHPGKHRGIEGLEHLDKVISIDQSPIGRTPRSNPATYTKALDPIRQLFAQLPEAKVRGYDPGRFSFNVKGGRCETCEGLGYQRIEMDFLDDVWVECDQCGGSRFNQDTLQVRYRDQSIADVLAMTVDEAREHFADLPQVNRVLQTLYDVGLDYLQLGQPAPTLSGGEAQRIKLARELSKRSTGRTMYLLDEPTTGLHFLDIGKLLAVLQRFVEDHNTVIVIEHNLDVIKCADYVIDLGPDGGEAGGAVVATGTPEELARVPESYTGQSLQPIFGLAEPTDLRRAVEANGDQPGPWAPLSEIVVQGARAHNLKNIDVRIPREKLTVLTGVSGSGKSSLAIDTIYAEGQRRYVESLSSYARQFIHQLEKPPVDFVSGLSPAISIEQRPGTRNPRSTVGTVTEIYDYLRLLWARLGTRHCIDDGARVGRQTSDEMTDRIQSLPVGTRVHLLAPLVLARNESYDDAFARLRRDGFLRVRIDGQVHELNDELSLDRRRRHEVEVVVDRTVVRPDRRSRVAEAVETAIDRGAGQMLVEVLSGVAAETGVRPGDILFSTRWTCTECGRAYDELTPQSFSFNSPLGWCPTCEGLGSSFGVDPALVIPVQAMSIADGGVRGLDIIQRRRPLRRAFEEVAKAHGWRLDQPLAKWPKEERQVLLWGSDEPLPFVTDGGAKSTQTWEGLVPVLSELYEMGQNRAEIGELRRDVACPDCHGARLRPEAAAARFRGLTIQELTDQNLAEALAFLSEIELGERESAIAAEPLREATRRLQFLVDVGLDYLSLSRASGSLSGGEAQRIRLASQIGSGLTGVLYILDEPTIGLHQRDNARLLRALTNLRDLGNTVLMVEHDAEAIRTADHVLDFGPGAGVNGGQVVAAGTPAEIATSTASLTGQYLSHQRRITIPEIRRPGNQRTLTVHGARHHNLKGLDVHFPLGTLTVVTGVSGSGKSSLVNEILYPALARELHRSQITVGEHDSISGLEFLDKVICIDQRPIGDNPRSNPASYVGAFDAIRELYQSLPESKARGYAMGRFSFNVPGGRCEACWGLGSRKIEMHFLADVWVPCEECGGRRYNPETLQIDYRGKSIADVLDATVAEMVEHFQDIPSVRRSLATLQDVGLEYLTLGQSALTLSGGEAQRVKLARELSRPSTGQTLYLLDEPTTGLHFEDVRRLLQVLDRFVDEGNTVVVIEHNLEVIKHADHVIDLGPEGGDAGGDVVAVGTPEMIARNERSFTGQVLRGVLDPDRQVSLAAAAAAPEVIEDPDERWHRLQLGFSDRRDAVWTGADLDALLRVLRGSDGEVGEPDWRNQEYVTLGAEGVRRWWVRIRTSRPDGLRLMLRTRGGAFTTQAVVRRAGLKPWAELEPPLERRGSRVTLKRRGAEDEVWLELARAEEFTTDSFQALLRDLFRQFGE